VNSHVRKYGAKESHPIPLWNGIFEHFINRMAARAARRPYPERPYSTCLALSLQFFGRPETGATNCELIDVSKLRLPQRHTPYEAPHFTLEQLQKILAIAGARCIALSH
jgi:hypothetical protein